MPHEALGAACLASQNKSSKLFSNPLGYTVSSMLAGAYVGVGVFLAFLVGSPLAAAGNPFQRIAMGASFAVALSLVIFAGGELFTGNTMTMPLGCWGKRVSFWKVAAVCAASWVGNLIGAAVLAWLLDASGVFSSGAELALVLSTAEKKMHLPWSVLVARGVLCNWLVCLGVWCSYRMKSESGKLIMIFWCLYAFVAAGFEHSVANMTLLTLALLLPHASAVSAAGMFYNLAWVTLGNIIGGAIMVGGAYRLSAGKQG